METIIAHEAEAREVHYPGAPVSTRRRAYAATLVAGLYVLLVLGAPLIVRYGPDPEGANAPAAVAVAVRQSAPRCASAPEFGHSCTAGDTAATPK